MSYDARRNEQEECMGRGGGSKIRRAEGQRAGQVFTGRFSLLKGIFALRDKYFNSSANLKGLKRFIQVFLFLIYRSPSP